jgi:ubiquinone/menaquinone biosynthesis C-methylase UbiE
LTGNKTRLSSTERRRRFFYGEADAPLYDDAVELNTPIYGLVNRTLLELLDNHFGVGSTKKRARIRGHFLDIGSGTGAQSIAILERFPNLRSVELDLCEPMHRILEQKTIAALGRAGFKERCTLVTADIMSSAGSPRRLLQPLSGSGKGTKYKAVVTAFALHHLTDREKLRAYRRIFEVLEPGGLFINADLFSFHSPTLKVAAQKFTIDYINKQHTDPDPEFVAAFRAVGPAREHLRKAWVRHCSLFNIPGPIECAEDGVARSKSAKTDNGQARMLLNAGFAEVGCPLRYWQVGILWGRK